MTSCPAATFRLAAHCFAYLVEEISPGGWDGPGLGVWNLRSLVGHTSRALSTVGTYLQQPAAEERIASAAQYFAFARQYAEQAGAESVAERGRVAGVALGDDPALAIRTLVAEVLSELDEVVGDPIIETLGGGMRLTNYLPTRTFELAVHIGDIAAATDRPITLPEDVIGAALAVAAEVATLLGDGPAVLRSLTGRASLPVGFSIV